MRNYKRHIGVLLSTHWNITEMEMGVFEKEYDQTEAQYYLERKIIKLNPNGMIDIQWIQERKLAEEIIREEIEKGGDTQVEYREEPSGEPVSDEQQDEVQSGQG